MIKIILSAAAAFGLVFGGAKTVEAVQKGKINEPVQAMEQWSIQEEQTQTSVDDASLLQTQEQTQQQLHDQTCDPLLDLTCEPTQDKLQLQDQDQLHQTETEPLHLYPNSGNGTGDGTCDDCVPQLEPGPHGNGGNGGGNNP